MSNERKNCCCGQGRHCPTHGAPKQETPSELAPADGSVPTVEQCFWMADTYCQRDSWANEFWRPHVSVLSAEVRRLRAVIAETLRDNAHLADGEDCTLINLRRAIAPNNALSNSHEI